MPNKEIFEGDNFNPFANKSGPRGDVNNGNNGKFTESQTQFRMRLHAKSITNQYPRLSEFPGIFKEKFNIDISLDAEKQWRRTNLDLILKRKQEMIDAGDLEVVTIGPKALADNLQALLLNTTKMLTKVQKKMNTSVDRIGDVEKHLTGERREKLSTEAREDFKVLSDAYAKISSGVTKQIESLANIAGVARGMVKETDEKNYKDKANKAVSQDFDPSAVEISDEDRAAAG